MAYLFSYLSPPSGPIFLISSATLLALSKSMSGTATSAPASASAMAIALPIPLPAPVTMAFLPVKSNVIFHEPCQFYLRKAIKPLKNKDLRYSLFIHLSKCFEFTLFTNWANFKNMVNISFSIGDSSVALFIKTHYFFNANFSRICLYAITHSSKSIFRHHG